MYICSYMLTFLLFKILFRFQTGYCIFFNSFLLFFQPFQHPPNCSLEGWVLTTSEWHGQCRTCPQRATSLVLSFVTTPSLRTTTSRRWMLVEPQTPSCCKVSSMATPLMPAGIAGAVLRVSIQLYFSFRPVAQHGVPHQRCECVRGTRKPTSHRNPENE